jgi:hypothetical protein
MTLRPLPAFCVHSPASRPEGARRFPHFLVRLLAAGLRALVAWNGSGTGRCLLVHCRIRPYMKKAQRGRPFRRTAGTGGPGRAMVTSGPLDTGRQTWTGWSGPESPRHGIAAVKRSQPLLHAQVRALPWRQDADYLRITEGRRDPQHPRRNPPPAQSRLRRTRTFTAPRRSAVSSSAVMSVLNVQKPDITLHSKGTEV